ncbi:hypothetical protein EEL32_08025 [Brevibacillus laterosporus]|nr:insecticidal delta-endotoxin Cry8Ea1 family protein [Brevibacillus laterosporus]TPG88745.1 hypothetical protein EEL32_08025 [Brevibacillus laterosporus]
MNKNDKNKYEIVDDSQNSSHISNRYPLANNPNQKLQNTNYKDWLATCNNTSLVDFVPYEVTWQGATIAAITIVAAVASMFTLGPGLLIVGGISAGAYVLASIVPLLWPADQDNTFDLVMEATEKLIDKKISELVRTLTEVKIKELQAQYDDYKLSFNHWVRYPHDPKAIADVKASLGNFNYACVGAMEALSMKGYEVAQLGAYAQAANLHLLLLRDGILYADYWNLAKDAPPGELNYERFIKYRKDYIDYCSHWYNEGLIDADENNNGLVYQRTMTILVLDVIAMFPMYDARLYNKPVKMEFLTRTIYTDQINGNHGKSIYDRNLFRRLQEVELYTNKIGGTSLLVGHCNKYKRMDDEIITGDLQGYVSADKKPLDFDYRNVYQVKTTSYAGRNIREMIFKGTGNNEWKYNIGQGDSIQYSTIPQGMESSISYNNYSHYLSDCIFSSVVLDNEKYIFGWNHTNVDPTGNYVTDAEEDEQENYNYQISQVPAVKASELINNNSPAGGISVEEGPYFTGGNVLLSSVKLFPNQPGIGQTDMKIKLPIIQKSFKQPSRKYRIRMYYAANHDHSIVFKQPGNNNQGSKISFKSTCNLEQDHYKAKFEHFKYVEADVLTIFGSDGTVTLCTLELSYADSVVRAANGWPLWLMIDKIEFIPVES